MEHTIQRQTSSGKTVLLFSSGWCPLSPSHPTQFFVNGTRFKSLNQYIQASKAKAFSDLGAFEMIMKSNKAKTQYELGNMVNGYNREDWKTMAPGILRIGISNRYCQDPASRELLLSTADSELVYSSLDDTLLGNGMTTASQEAAVKKHWLGQNILGQELMHLRDRLRQDI